MVKKTFIALIIALVLGLGVMGLVRTTHAQDIEVNEVSEEAIAVPVQMTTENELAHQYGDQNAGEPIMTQTRTRLRELQENGECTGECDPQQLRLHQNLGADNQPELKQQRLDDGTCTGDGVPQRRGGRNQ